MTKPHLTDLLNRLYPAIVSSLEPDRIDSYQEAVEHLLKCHERYNPADDREFTLLLHKCASLLYRRERSHRYDHLKRAGATEVTIDDERDAVAGLYDTSAELATAHEYIQFLPKVYRRVFHKVFVEGKGTVETSTEMHMTRQHINTMLTDGVRWIREELEAT